MKTGPYERYCLHMVASPKDLGSIFSKCMMKEFMKFRNTEMMNKLKI